MHRRQAARCGFRLPVGPILYDCFGWSSLVPVPVWTGDAARGAGGGWEGARLAGAAEGVRPGPGGCGGAGAGGGAVREVQVVWSARARSGLKASAGAGAFFASVATSTGLSSTEAAGGALIRQA